MWLLRILKTSKGCAGIYHPSPHSLLPFKPPSILVHQQTISYLNSMTTSSITTTAPRFCSSLHGTWGTSISGEDYSTMLAKTTPAWVRVNGKPLRYGIMMGNVNAGKGLFAPAVAVTRNIVGKKRFNQLRGKAIALHSQVINEFCKSIGADSKQRQGLIRLAKKNGEKLGFLA